MTHHQKAAARAGVANRINAHRRAESYRWFIEPLARSGLSLRELAKTMNVYQFRAPRGDGEWYPTTVMRTLQRLDLYEQETA